MRALRLIIEQSSANYKKEETVENKMTYPLPPVSTIIGALHNICGYKEYKDMDISIQGKFESMHREPYTDYCFLNSIQDDRGILVKMKNKNLLSNAFEKVASAQKPQGNSFREGKTINVINQELLEEYRRLKALNDEIDRVNNDKLQPVIEEIKSLKERKKKFAVESKEYADLVKREKELKALEKKIKDQKNEFKRKNYTEPMSQFRSLTTSLKFYEILDGIKLILHIKAKENVLNDILENIYDLKCIGRSEDTVRVENAEIVELQEETDKEEVESKYSVYIDYGLVKEGRIYPREKKGKVSGTRYYLNKNYKIVDGKRVFEEKKKVLYTSNFAADEFGEGVYLDEYKGEEFIVSFL